MFYYLELKVLFRGFAPLSYIEDGKGVVTWEFSEIRLFRTKAKARWFIENCGIPKNRLRIKHVSEWQAPSKSLSAMDFIRRIFKV